MHRLTVRPVRISALTASCRNDLFTGCLRRVEYSDYIANTARSASLGVTG